MGPRAVSEARRGRYRLTALLTLLLVVVGTAWYIAKPWVYSFVTILAAVLVILITLLAANTSSTRLTDLRFRLGPAAIVIAGLVIHLVGASALRQSGGGDVFITLGSFFGILVAYAIVSLTDLLITRPGVAKAGFALIIIAGVVSVLLAAIPLLGVSRPGILVTITGGAFLGLLLGLSVYVGGTLWSNAPADVFPGVTRAMRRRGYG